MKKETLELVLSVLRQVEHLSESKMDGGIANLDIAISTLETELDLLAGEL
jgi:hypothetical protein